MERERLRLDGQSDANFKMQEEQEEEIKSMSNYLCVHNLSADDHILGTAKSIRGSDFGDVDTVLHSEAEESEECFQVDPKDQFSKIQNRPSSASLKSSASLENGEICKNGDNVTFHRKNMMVSKDRCRSSLNEEHSDFSCDQISPDLNNGSQTLFHRCLQAGFDFCLRDTIDQMSVRKKLDTNDQDSTPSYSFTKSNRLPLINVIDPTSVHYNQNHSGILATSPSRRRAWNRDKAKPRINHLRLFEKINIILQQRYESTLTSIKYENPSTNQVEIIEKLPIRTQLTAPMVADAINWHEDPLCHVYIAACYSVDHYREKVRPAIRAFVNQIDGAASGNEEDVISAASNAARKEFGAKRNADNKKLQVDAATKAVAAAKDATGPTASSQYMIIFVPINPSSIESDVSPIEDLSNEVGVGFRGRFAAAAKRAQLKEPDDDEVGVDSIQDCEGHSNQVTHLSKEHREIYKKIRRDFERGEKSILSTLLDSENNLLEETPSQNEEFNEVLQQLGRTLLEGFYDRIEKYVNEIRRCEREQSSSKWSRYFLLKESLSFSFEQMQLPYQAIREYEELELILPVGSMINNAKEDIGTYCAAILGDSNDFRSKVQETANIEEIYDYCMLYIVSRKISILFHHKDPIRALVSIYRYIKRSYAARCDIIQSMSEKEKISQLVVESEILAMSLCWDVKQAIEPFYSLILQNKSKQTELNLEIIKIINDLIDFVRIRSLRFSEIRVSKGDCISEALIHRKYFSQESWVPWDQIELLVDTKSIRFSRLCCEGNALIFLDDEKNVNSAVRNIYESEEKFMAFVININESMVSLSKYLKRDRYACRILADLAELYMYRNDIERSVGNLILAIDNCANDAWDEILAWKFFRLLLSQRMRRNATEYFKTATYFLGERFSKSVPENIKLLLMRDMNTLVSYPDIVELRWAATPLFGVDIVLQDRKKSNAMSGNMKNITFHPCKLGDTVTVNVVISSYLAEDIVLDRIELIVLTFSRYLELVDAHSVVDRSDIAFVLAIEKALRLNPGKSSFCFPWIATDVDKFVISSIRFKWKGTTFHHDYTIQQQIGVSGINVQPNKPTQRISINPAFLISGHTQAVQLTFHAGSDVIHRGDVEFKCSHGLKVKTESNEDGDWQETGRFSFNSCKPNEKLRFTVTIKSENIGSRDDIRHVKNNLDYSTLQTLKALVTTSFQHDLFKNHIEGENLVKVVPMTAMLEASVTTLDRAAFSLEKVQFFTLGSHTAILNISIVCNTPVPFGVNTWNISLPNYLSLFQGGDMTDFMCSSSVIEGDQLYFSFRCIIHEHGKIYKESQGDFHANLHLFLHDGCGKSFDQVIPIDISTLCCKTEEYSDIVSANLLPRQMKGIVCEPVVFTYNLRKVQSVSKDNPSQIIIFRLVYNHNDWIIAGSVCGSIKVYPDDNDINLHFIAIPIKCGRIERFPDLHLSQNDYKTIKVVTQDPISFLSTPHKKINGVGFPS
jgi:DNA-binding ferritin-like protein (Dps family)